MSVLTAGSSQNRDPPPNQVENSIRILTSENVILTSENGFFTSENVFRIGFRREAKTSEAVHGMRQPGRGPEQPDSSGSHEAKTAVGRIENVIGSGDEPSSLDHLRGEVTQTLVDVLHEVRLSIHSLLKRRLITLSLPLSIGRVESITIRFWNFHAFPHDCGRSA